MTITCGRHHIPVPGARRLRRRRGRSAARPARTTRARRGAARGRPAAARRAWIATSTAAGVVRSSLCRGHMREHDESGPQPAARDDRPFVVSQLPFAEVAASAARPRLQPRFGGIDEEQVGDVGGEPRRRRRKPAGSRWTRSTPPGPRRGAGATPSRAGDVRPRGRRRARSRRALRRACTAVGRQQVAHDPGVQLPSGTTRPSGSTTRSGASATMRTVGSRGSGGGRGGEGSGPSSTASQTLCTGANAAEATARISSARA